MTAVVLGAVAIAAGVLWALAEIWVWMDAAESAKSAPLIIAVVEHEVADDEAVWSHPSLPPRWPLQ